MADADQIEAARSAAIDAGSSDIIAELVNSNVVNYDNLLGMLAQQYGMEMVSLEDYDIPQEVIDSLRGDYARYYQVVPVSNDGVWMTVAMEDPTDMEKLDTLRYLLGSDVDAVIAPIGQILAAIEKYYPEEVEDTGSSQKDVDIGSAEMIIGEESGFAAGTEDDDNAPIIRLVSKIIIDAYKMRASDIHLEPMEKRYRVRYRIDGSLREVDGPPKYLQSNFTSRMKIMAHLDITEKRIPQDGRIQLSVGDKDIDLRVSSIPTVFGESIVMRILDKSSIQLDIPRLGFYADDLELVTRIINYPDGIFLVTGPTGSGKTTSLYAFLNTINTTARKLITVEDPIEYQLPGINQVQVDRHVDMTFAAALRSMLRQAPNIIMVGEIRDLETAEIAINAALTGHLVFSTLHTNDAPGAVARLVDMGVKPFLVATALRAAMAQRLLRRVCKECAEPYTPSAAEKRILGLSDEYLANHKFIKGKGCRHCGYTGYKGRVGIYEIFLITEEIARLIFANETSGTLRSFARRNGMRSLRDDAIRKAEAGISTLEEVIFVTMRDEN
ncbi:MAG: Flp pilus assembly complex ATPase component TadA [Lentisphaeria bacterium]|nr:type II/IV secretion system protein [Lentisphaerota bacterium]MBR2625835.1 Flp pilus assembly complex ATPase component TadA [Lentisphaeria bacterium]